MDQFTPADGVTIDNALRFIEAVEAAAKRDFSRLPRSERALAVALVAGALRMASDRVNLFRDKIEKTGAADPLTEEQKMSLKMIFRKAMEDESMKAS